MYLSLKNIYMLTIAEVLDACSSCSTESRCYNIFLIYAVIVGFFFFTLDTD